MTSAMPPSPAAALGSDRPEKLARLQRLLDEQRAEAIRLSSPEMLGWLFDGARVSVPYGGAPVFEATVRRDGEIVVTALQNEFERLAAEELSGDYTLQSRPWYEAVADAAPGVLVEAQLPEAMRQLRASLLPAERQRYREFGAQLAQAVTRLLRELRPETTEQQLAAELGRAVIALGAEPVVLLVAGRQRSHVQHPLPTPAPLGSRAMAVVGARRHGLVINLSRWVRFGGAAAGGRRDAAAGDARGLEAVEEALLQVEADAYAATRPGRRLDEVLADIAAAYPRHGFGAEAWLAHHQGGPTGYLGRDPKATPDARQQVVAGQAFAWNPWVPGAKLEDTVVVDTDGTEVLSLDPEWPARDIRGMRRPLTLDLD